MSEHEAATAMVAKVDADRALVAGMGVVSTLSIDKDAALRKMLEPSWQKKKRDSRIEVPCEYPGCTNKHMVERTRPRPWCADCYHKHGTFNGRRKP